jgi:hypothetical protein
VAFFRIDFFTGFRRRSDFIFRADYIFRVDFMRLRIGAPWEGQVCRGCGLCWSEVVRFYAGLSETARISAYGPTR